MCLNLNVLNPYILNGYDRSEFDDSQALIHLFEEIRQLLDDHSNQPIYFVLSSSTNFLENFSEQDVIKFVTSIV